MLEGGPSTSCLSHPLVHFGPLCHNQPAGMRPSPSTLLPSLHSWREDAACTGSVWVSMPSQYRDQSTLCSQEGVSGLCHSLPDLSSSQAGALLFISPILPVSGPQHCASLSPQAFSGCTTRSLAHNDLRLLASPTLPEDCGRIYQSLYSFFISSTEAALTLQKVHISRLRVSLGPESLGQFYSLSFDLC